MDAHELWVRGGGFDVPCKAVLDAFHCDDFHVDAHFRGLRGPDERRVADETCGPVAAVEHGAREGLFSLVEHDARDLDGGAIHEPGRVCAAPELCHGGVLFVSRDKHADRVVSVAFEIVDGGAVVADGPAVCECVVVHFGEHDFARDEAACGDAHGGAAVVVVVHIGHCDVGFESGDGNHGVAALLCVGGAAVHECIHACLGLAAVAAEGRKNVAAARSHVVFVVVFIVVVIIIIIVSRFHAELAARVFSGECDFGDSLSACALVLPVDVVSECEIRAVLVGDGLAKGIEHGGDKGVAESAPGWPKGDCAV
eukprot:comp22326_c0_seq1/m.53619 comp22326_c0_seq1/g.53619  ORF comp22326_c0_seq1/g.53619 comp22326_c0_seq1/m.53619 type:complete len:311 (-) comp22326_c0_seq1:181-1113(-)